MDHVDDAVTELFLRGQSARGYRCRRTSEGRGTVADLVDPSESSPALITVDTSLRGLDGFDVLEHLRREGALRKTRATVLTVPSSESEAMRAPELDAFNHVTKTFSLLVLLQISRSPLESP